MPHTHYTPLLSQLLPLQLLRAGVCAAAGLHAVHEPSPDCALCCEFWLGACLCARFFANTHGHTHIHTGMLALQEGQAP